MTRRYLLPVNDIWSPRSDPKAHDVVGDSRTAPFWFYHWMNESLISALFRVPSVDYLLYDLIGLFTS